MKYERRIPKVSLREFAERFLIYPFYAMWLSLGGTLIIAVLHHIVENRKPKRNIFLGKIEWFLDDFQEFIGKIAGFFGIIFVGGALLWTLYDLIHGFFK